MNSIIENILTRRSIRTFRGTQISEEDLNTILTAGSYAPNGMGTQSWKFTVIQKTSVLAKVNEAIRLTLISIPVVAETHPYVVSLVEKAKDESSNFLYHAPTFIIVSNLKGQWKLYAGFIISHREYDAGSTLTRHWFLLAKSAARTHTHALNP